MIRFFKGLKRAAKFFNTHPLGISFVTERRLKDIEASVSKLPKAIEDRTLTRIINLEYDLYKLERTIQSIQEKLDKEQVQTPIQSELPTEQAKTVTARKPGKRKALKLQAVEEEVKTVKSKLTQAQVKRLLEYRDGELYWKVDRGGIVKKGYVKKGLQASKNYSTQKLVFFNGTSYTASRLIFLMFYGYLPEKVSFIDGNSFNTKIENLRAATSSQVKCHSTKYKNNVSGYKGVCFSKKKNKYKAAIKKNRKHYSLGFFDTPQEAHKAYCKAAKKLHGEFAQVI